jgi:hypothetical protein
VTYDHVAVARDNRRRLELAERAGRSKPAMSLDVYTHVMPVAEVAEERFRAVLARHG